VRDLPGLWAGDPFWPHTWGNCSRLPYLREKLESPDFEGGTFQRSKTSGILFEHEETWDGEIEKAGEPVSGSSLHV